MQDNVNFFTGNFLKAHLKILLPGSAFFCECLRANGSAKRLVLMKYNPLPTLSGMRLATVLKNLFFYKKNYCNLILLHV